jgi:hypothetical protein
MATIEYIRGVVGVGDVSGDERDVSRTTPSGTATYQSTQHQSSH